MLPLLVLQPMLCSYSTEYLASHVGCWHQLGSPAVFAPSVEKARTDRSVLLQLALKRKGNRCTDRPLEKQYAAGLSHKPYDRRVGAKSAQRAHQRNGPPFAKLKLFRTRPLILTTGYQLRYRTGNAQ
ncbi:hypothetical protein EJ06DRAFT_296051 [Trichodelitschia bisporula]|uniref:Uncharacterized protein n=1 Tax=Trichodelitschia bisporula TaxID=703511 RepID=A0A6G1I6C2_9PEZI|nr:hypothetical protein EJ06DRAFT_296051 [Trichodelitschia bisporula]